MTSKAIKLSIPEPILKKLKTEKKTFAYSSVQEIIIETLREKYFRTVLGKRSPGRPPKLREGKIITRRKIFDKRGAKLDV